MISKYQKQSMTTTTSTPRSSLPAEYQERKQYHFSAHPGNKTVEARIQAAIEARNLPSAIRGTTKFNVRIVEPKFDEFYTRVYIGWYGDRTFISSKKNQSIDLDRAVDAIVEEATERHNLHISHQAMRARADRARDNVDALRAELNLSNGWRDEIRLQETGRAGEVTLTYSRTLSLVEARALVGKIRAL